MKQGAYASTIAEFTWPVPDLTKGSGSTAATTLIAARQLDGQRMSNVTLSYAATQFSVRPTFS